jgi:hypothetical protein
MTARRGGEPGRDERQPGQREAAPPIEREHETYAGVFEEDERRERERERESERQRESERRGGER